jgi:hypothetical protein
MRYTLLLSLLLFIAPPVLAADIYVDANGTVPSEGCNGDYSTSARNCTGSDGDAYTRLATAVSYASDGDRIIVRAGTWAESSTVVISNFNGLTIEAYPGEGWDEAPGEGNHPCIDMNSNNFPEAEGFTPIIRVRYSSDVTIDGLELREYGVGVYVDNSGGFSLINSQSHHHFRYGAAMVESSEDFLIEGNEFHTCNLRKHYHNIRGGGQVVANVGAAGIFRRNIVRDGCWEGLNIGFCAGLVIVEYNIFYGNNEANIYMVDSDHAIIRYNLVYGTELGPNLANVGDGRSPGIWISGENHNCSVYDLENNFTNSADIYGNLVADEAYSFNLTGQCDQAHLPDYVNVFNNTFIGAQVADVRVRAVKPCDGVSTVVLGTHNQFKNNIIWNTIAPDISVAADAGYLDADWNLWSEAPVSHLQGSNDLPYSAPGVFKTSGWNSGTGGINALDFELQEGSPAENAGSSGVGADYRYLLPSDESDITSIAVSNLIDNFQPRYIGDTDADLGAIPFDGGTAAPPPVDPPDNPAVNILDAWCSGIHSSGVEKR